MTTGKDETRNSKVLKDFVAYCEAHKDQRFWQALRNWSGYPFIFAGMTQPNPSLEDDCFDPYTDLIDTFYWEGKDHDG